MRWRRSYKSVIDTAQEAQTQRFQISVTGQSTPATQQDRPVRESQPKLPELKLPEFSGKYTDWMIFKNTFEAAIHDNPNLTPIRKLQYLMGQLKGEANQVISGFKLSNENYPIVWRLLNDTYDNKVMFIENHLEELFNFPSIVKEDKSESIRQLIQTHTASLKTLNQPVDQWNTIIIYLAKRHLDFVERRDWQDHVKDRTCENMPTLEEFAKFLTERSHMLRMLRQDKMSKSNSK